jgi:hypothetical protein
MLKTKRSMPPRPARLVLTLVAAAGLVTAEEPAEAPSRALTTSVAVTTHLHTASSAQVSAPRMQPSAPKKVPAPRVQPSAPKKVPAPRVQPSARPQLSAPRITRTEHIRYAATVSTMQALLDRCDGSVAIRFSGIAVRLLTEHDYCGGLWILHLDRGEVIEVVGGGIGGIYRVNGNIKVVPKGTSAYVLRGMGGVVAQTCRADGDTLRLVGLTKLR